MYSPRPERPSVGRILSAGAWTIILVGSRNTDHGVGPGTSHRASGQSSQFRNLKDVNACPLCCLARSRSLSASPPAPHRLPTSVENFTTSHFWHEKCSTDM